ncbi:MAG: hypothetical protein QM638_00030 [Nocardioides sp.]|uniref:hypothetical protein n=1 Tax=Nocardioides sp. TaxID=35761 RepID=UPI0039E706E6
MNALEASAFVKDLGYTLDGAWKVLLAGLILGAGLCAVYAVGIRGMALSAAGSGEAGQGGQGGRQGNAIGYVIAGVCLLIVLYGIVSGIMIVLGSGLGKDVTFDHVIPMFTEKS